MAVKILTIAIIMNGHTMLETRGSSIEMISTSSTAVLKITESLENLFPSNSLQTDEFSSLSGRNGLTINDPK